MDLTVIGIFYSGYKDLWHEFVTIFKKNWADCPFDLLIVSDTENEDSFEGVRLISCGKEAEYSRKVQVALKEVKTKYVLLLLEDFYLGSKVDNSKVLSILDYIKSSNTVYYCMPMKEFSYNFKGKVVNRKRKVRRISPKAEYTLNCQPSIWERDFLFKAIGTDNYNAWVFEGAYSKSKKAHDAEFLKDCLVDLSNPLDLIHGVVQGLFLPDSIEYFSKQGYSFSTSRQVMPWKKRKKVLFKVRLVKFIPYWCQRLLKKILKKESVLDKHSNEINRIVAQIDH